MNLTSCASYRDREREKEERENLHIYSCFLDDHRGLAGCLLHAPVRVTACVTRETEEKLGSTLTLGIAIGTDD